MKKILLALIVFALCLSLTACGEKDKEDKTTTENTPVSDNNQTKDIEIYFLNFKPEVADIYKQIAKDYEAETGVKVKIVTAASDTYEQTLSSEISKSKPPTIFQINGPIGYEGWKNYCADLSETKFYSLLSEKSLAISNENGVFGVPYAIEGYGIIYNDEITNKYFALESKSTDFDSMDDINDFEEFKALVEDMSKHKEELGIKGVFASTSFSSGNQWRWNTHLLNVPFHFEMEELGKYSSSTLAGLSEKEFNFKYSEEFKSIFDLYLNNSITPKALVGSKGVNDSMAEFALGEVAMVQNGSWAYSEINSLDGNVVKEENIKMMPIYMGLEDEEETGLCIGTENYFAINSKVSPELQQASDDFLYWLFSSETGKRYVTEELGFVTPFETLKDASFTDPLAKQVLLWTNKDGVTSVPWAFNSFPSLSFKDDVGNALLEYAQGTASWNEAVEKIKNSWKQNKQ